MDEEDAMNYDVIYLQPANPSGERLWCQDDNPDGGGGWVKYVRADSEAVRLAREALAAVKEDHDDDADYACGADCNCGMCKKIAAALAALGGGNG